MKKKRPMIFEQSLSMCWCYLVCSPLWKSKCISVNSQRRLQLAMGSRLDVKPTRLRLHAVVAYNTTALSYSQVAGISLPVVDWKCLSVVAGGETVKILSYLFLQASTKDGFLMHHIMG